MTYPEKISRILSSLSRAKFSANATGAAASFSCGSFVRFELFFSGDGTRIDDSSFRSNGCGYMVACAQILTLWLRGRLLTELSGMDDTEIRGHIAYELEVFPPDRSDCESTCIAGLRAALSDYRSFRISEFRGDSPLICSCFGVTEEVIERVISENSANSVDEVAAICNAGSGCGSCRMLIEELIAANETDRL